MLSAVAARKAAQAARSGPSESVQTPLAQQTPARSPPSSSPEDLPSKTVSKRKATGPNAKKGKKKLKVKHVDKRTPRYFEDVETEDNVMIVDGLDSELEDEQFEFPVSVEASASQTLISSGPKRAWTPSVPMQDSSDEDEGDNPGLLDVPVTAQPLGKAADDSILSSFQPIAEQNMFTLTDKEIRDLKLGGSTTIVILRLGESLALLGTYTVTVLQGSISLLGVTISASRRAYEVFAPRSSPIPVLRSVAFAQSGDSKPTIVSLPLRVRNSCEENDAVVIIQELRTGVEGLGRVCRTFDNIFSPSRWQADAPDQQLGLTGVHILMRHTRDVHPFLIPSAWEAALSSILPSNDDDTAHVNPVVCLIKGPKKSGKSTFSRTILNRLLTGYQKVAFLECDLGQSEFTPAGMVALNVIEKPVFGPPFTHPTIPHFAHYIGSTSPRTSPSHYLSAIQSLLESYRLDIQSNITDDSDSDDARVSDFIPLVVNTMGWSKGLGADLTRKIEDMIEPTDVFEFEAPIFEMGWSAPPPLPHSLPTRTYDARIHLLQPISTSVLSSNYSPADHRTISILSYFHAVFPPAPRGDIDQISATSWNTALPLCAQPPFEVDWTVAFDKVVLTGAGSEDVVSSEIKRVLNGSVVGLVSCEPGTMDIDTSMPLSGSHSTIPYSQGSSTPMPSTSKCHGLAVIRSISPISSHMHILTPIPTYQLSRCRLIVKGELELPIWGMLDYRGNNGEVAGVEKEKIPYFQWGKGEGLGGERRRVRRNLMRKGQT